jgi:Sulfotransferase family
VRWFAELRQLFPQARFILLVRNPRDVLISAWHHNARLSLAWAEAKDLQVFVREVVPIAEQNIRPGESFGAAWPAQFLCLSYEALTDAPEASLLRLFGFLGVSAKPELAACCAAAAAFERPHRPAGPGRGSGGLAPQRRGRRLARRADGGNQSLRGREGRVDARTLSVGGEVIAAPGVITLSVPCPSRASARPGRGTAGSWISSAIAISGMSATICRQVYQMAPVRLGPRRTKTAFAGFRRDNVVTLSAIVNSES